MSEIVVSHGYGASADSVWFPYLTERLAAVGHRVTVPRLPHTEAPRLGPWRETFGDAALAAGPAGSTVLVGHSIGGVNVLRLLEQHDPEVNGVFAGVLLVATSAHEVGYNELAPFFEGASTGSGSVAPPATSGSCRRWTTRSTSPIRPSTSGCWSRVSARRPW